MKDLLEFFVYQFSIIIVCLIVAGTLFYVARKIIGPMASPIFASLYYLESIEPLKFKFHLPKNGWKRLIMDVCGSMSFGITLSIIYSVCSILIIKPKSENNLSSQIIIKEIMPFSLCLLNIICFSIIILISRTVKSDEDKKDWFDKIMDLKFPKSIDPS